MYGQDIYTFVSDLTKAGFEIIYVLGEPGTGKSTGMRTLPHDTNIWFNADGKNPVWTGGVEEYGRKINPRYPFHTIPTDYPHIIGHIQNGLSKGNFENVRFAFLLGHTEVFKAGNDSRERLKILGKLATKMQLEGKAETVFYSKVQIEEGKPKWILETQNNGFNTARSHQGMFETTIPNDYNLVIENLLKF